MEVILLERMPNLGEFGNIVKVKDGYARNYLLPLGKAARATEASKHEFEQRKAQIQQQSDERKDEAEKLVPKVQDKFIILIKQAAEDGRLYGSVSSKEISDEVSAIAKSDFKRGQVVAFSPIKNLGVHVIKISLHPEVEVKVNVIVARSETEAQIAKKEFLNPTTVKATDANDGAETVTATAEVDTAETATAKKKKKKAVKLVKIDLKSEEESAAS